MINWVIKFLLLCVVQTRLKLCITPLHGWAGTSCSAGCVWIWQQCLEISRTVTGVHFIKHCDSSYFPSVLEASDGQFPTGSNLFPLQTVNASPWEKAFVFLFNVDKTWWMTHHVPFSLDPLVNSNADGRGEILLLSLPHKRTGVDLATDEVLHHIQSVEFKTRIHRLHAPSGQVSFNIHVS